jgi:hypothetical protein
LGSKTSLLNLALRADVLPLAHPEQLPAPRHGLVLDAPPMNGRRTSLSGRNRELHPGSRSVHPRIAPFHHRFLSDRERRKRRSAYHALSETVEDELPGVEGGQHSALEYRDFLRAFATLPAEQRSVLLLIAVEGLSYEEAARVLGVPIGTVVSRLSRGSERLRRLTGNDVDENVRHRGADALSRVT